MNFPEQDPHFFKKSHLTLENPFLLDGKEFSAAQIIEALSPQVTEERLRKFNAVISRRHLNFYTILENIYDRGNISAVMRSAEAFGFIRFHVVEPENFRFKAANRVTRGADKWIDVEVFPSIQGSLSRLQAQGVRVYGTSLKATKDISEMDFSIPSAIVIGNEKDGLSAEGEKLCDELFKIDMHGFSQSFNLSVAAALCFFHAERARKDRFEIKSQEHQMLLANYLLRTVEKPGLFLERLQLEN